MVLFDIFDKAKKSIGVGIEKDGSVFRVAKTTTQKNSLTIDFIGEFHLADVDKPEKDVGFKNFLEKNHLIKRRVATNLENTGLRIRRMELPPMPENDLVSAAKFNLKDQVEGQVEDYEIRYSILSKSQGVNPKQELVIYGIPNSVIKQEVELFKSLNLRLDVLEPSSVSVAAWFDRLNPDDPGINAIAHFGEASSIFVIVSNGKFLFSRLLDNPELLGLGDRTEFPDADAMLQTSLNIQKSIDSFCMIFRRDRVDRVVLSGKLAESPGFEEFLGRTLGITVEKIDKLYETQFAFDPLLHKQELIKYTVPLALSITPV